MPNNDTNPNNSRAINKKLDLLDQKMDSLYKDIYVSRPDNKHMLDDMIDSIDSVIDRLQGSETDTAGMTELIKRVDAKNNSNVNKMVASVQELFSDQNLLGTMFKNDDIHKFITAENYNYDLICKYLPRLQDALEIKRDNVLCSDNFSKDFVNPLSGKSSKEESQKFDVNAKRIEQQYDMQDFLEKTYMTTSKYGEDFIYIVPYNVAFARIFAKDARKFNSAKTGQLGLFEGYQEQKCLSNGYQNSKEFKAYSETVKEIVGKETFKENMAEFPNMGEVYIHFNNSSIVSSTIHEFAFVNEKTDSKIFESMASIFENANKLNEISEAKGDKKMTSLFDTVKNSNKKLATSGLANDGLLISSDYDRDAKKLDKNFLGAVLERLPRQNILPIYIGKKCLGYYYFEFAEDPNACGYCGGHHMTPGIANGSKYSYQVTENQQELAIRFIASRIARSIDTHFINSNKDLKEEIYAILNYNNKFDITRRNDIGVTFIPAEDIVHTYFEFDESTHRGISDLRRALIPAMLYILLYLTDIICKITRSTDKRVYYVKQNVETNIARTMMNVVQQIKKGNMGIRQIESMNNILNIVGKFNDYIIPVGPSGESPIQFEVMQGQDIQTPTDLMEKMEEAAVNTIMPLELVNSTYQQDFATRYTMTSTRFLKSLYTRMRKTEAFFSKIYTKVYCYEFGETNRIIEIVLPPPSYLTMNNNSQLFDNINQMADKLIELLIPDKEDGIKNEFKKNYIIENLGYYLDIYKINKMIDKSEVTYITNKPPATQDGADSEMEDMADDSL